jgi:hypothetical protein
VNARYCLLINVGPSELSESFIGGLVKHEVLSLDDDQEGERSEEESSNQENDNQGDVISKLSLGYGETGESSWEICVLVVHVQRGEVHFDIYTIN